MAIRGPRTRTGLPARVEPPALDHLLRGYPSDHEAIVTSSTGSKPAPTPGYAPRSGDGDPSPACIAQGFRIRFLKTRCTQHRDVAPDLRELFPGWMALPV
jgi:hypothetical protein